MRVKLFWLWHGTSFLCKTNLAWQSGFQRHRRLDDTENQKSEDKGFARSAWESYMEPRY